ncbi:group II intron maturase-specific domain-containing protein [Streptomyces sp. LN549]|uniref:group II intron maturase-specific domain-containing protein n=1 Tax=Streptomyces sp. LN549 TaxID=3112979 RepID=UPI0037153A4F
MWDLRGSNAEAVIRPVSPIIRGWVAYFRSGRPAGSSFAGLLRVAARLQVGQARTREQAEGLDRAPLLWSVQPPAG